MLEIRSYWPALIQEVKPPNALDVITSDCEDTYYSPLIALTKTLPYLTWRYHWTRSRRLMAYRNFVVIR
ncbi:hypothetical protein DPMN_137021 [Dreissena polymorpha]|uniref:Uncharacterized protein n=1 Tax=Dreissena polymorpha TaxID=45954 RepID=A0A9D4G3Y9_DREPO|nr:hypothetical protein DPMN_137021 [Dreissena polymorpha]